MRKMLLLAMSILMLSVQVSAQTRTISGKITDENGNPVVNASVLVKGSNLGTTSKEDGSFSLSVPPSARILTISAVGMADQDVSLGSKVVFDIKLRSGKAELQEVVVTGYTSELKKNYTGAAVVVGAAEIKNVPVASIDQLLQGKAAGLMVLAGSGQPGAAARVQIRGRGSINGSNTPLYILDGVPIEAGLFRGLNPNDFENVTVLKDAASTALYGARGANGVIVITSKKGKSGETRITVRNQYGQSTSTRSKFDMMNTAQRLQFEEIIGRQLPLDGLIGNFPGWAYSRSNPNKLVAGALVPKTQAELDAGDRYLDSLRKIDTDWQETFFRKGQFHMHELEVVGGSEKTRFFLSANYYDQEGITIRSNLKRYNLRANIDHTSGRFKIGLNTNLNFNKSNFIESEAAVALANPFAAAFLGIPYHSLYNPTTGKVLTGSGRVGGNAYDRIFTTTSVTNQIKGVVSLNTSFRITNWLTARSTFGLDYRQSDGSRFIKPDSYVGGLTTPGNAGLYSPSFGRYFSYVTSSGFDGAYTIADKHEIKGTLLYDFFRDYADNFAYTGYGINVKLPNTPAGITQGTTANGLIPAVSGGKVSTALESYIGLFNYTYDGKYSLSANLRRDGSTKSSPVNRYITLWSLGAAWNITNENFMASVTPVNYLKLRASYGVTSNNDGFPGNFNYLSTYGTTVYGSEPGIAPSALGNNIYTWEKAYTANVGLDFGVLQERITGTFEVYQKETRDLFISQQLSNTAGLGANPSLPLNAGKVRNKGVEWTLNVIALKTKDFELAFNVNGSYNKNRVTDLGQVTEFEQGTSIIREGLPLGSHYAVKWGGVDPQTGEPLYYDKEGKITKVYSASNSVPEFGTFDPPHTGGFGTDISYKGITVSAFFSYADGFSRYNNESFFYEYGNAPNVQFNQSVNMLKVWQKPGDITDYQSPKFARQFSSKDIEDASFIRFRNLNVSYNLPKPILNRMKVVKNLLFYVQAQNLFTWTKWRGFDPEDGNNIAQYEYPATRTYIVGLDITF